MDDCLNSVGFVFDKARICIKTDINCRYSQYYCQECAWINPNAVGYTNVISGLLTPCNNCTNNTQYKICIIKLQKSHFISSSLAISTSFDESWEKFKNMICLQRNGNFVISVGKKSCKNSNSKSSYNSHSFYANLIKAKKCNCCDAVMLYFKYNIIFAPHSIPTPAEIQQLRQLEQTTNPASSDMLIYKSVCANSSSNITYNLKSGDYYNVKFFYSQNYIFSPQLQNQICHSNEDIV
jgi:hypothetical protein